MNSIRVIKVEPGKIPELTSIENKLEAFQHAVGGYIETVFPFPDDVVLICNENGKIDRLPYNRALRDIDGDIVDIIRGTFLLAGTGGEDFADIPADLIADYMELYAEPEDFEKTENGIRIKKIPAH